jgi:hypothetical protein
VKCPVAARIIFAPERSVSLAAMPEQITASLIKLVVVDFIAIL